MKKVLKPFSWAHRGVDIKHYDTGAPIDPETDDAEMIEVGEREGWIGDADKPAKGGGKGGDADKPAKGGGKGGDAK